MKSAAIYLHGLPTIDKPTPIKTVKYQKKEALINELKKLQSAYCEDEKPKVKHHKKNNKVVVDCFSDSDFHYVAYIGYGIKISMGFPVEQL